MDENRSRSRGDLWLLANDWISKIDKAYNQYVLQKASCTKSAMWYLTAFVIVLLSFVILFEFSARRTSEFLGSVELKLVFFLIESIIITVGAFEFIRWWQILKSSRDELEDLLHISEDLLQMLISSEERHSAGGKYEYLINHVKILEVKHLLKKMERVVRVKFPFVP